MAAQRRGLPSPPRAVTAVSCVLLAALLCATQARAGTPWQVANDLRMNVTGPPLMLSAENQTLISVVEQVLEDPYGAGARRLAAQIMPCSSRLHLPQYDIDRSAARHDSSVQMRAFASLLWEAQLHVHSRRPAYSDVRRKLTARGMAA